MQYIGIRVYICSCRLTSCMVSHVVVSCCLLVRNVLDSVGCIAMAAKHSMISSALMPASECSVPGPGRRSDHSVSCLSHGGSVSLSLSLSLSPSPCMPVLWLKCEVWLAGMHVCIYDVALRGPERVCWLADLCCVYKHEFWGYAQYHQPPTGP